MKCINCGYENHENACFCQNCGSALIFDKSPLEARIRRLLKDELFLALCILYSVSMGFSFVSGSFSVTKILMLIFLWLLFTQSRKGILATDYMRYISGTIFASYIIKWIVYCIVTACGVLLLILFFTVNLTGIWDKILSAVESYTGDYFGLFSFVTNSYILSSLIKFIIQAAIGIVLNLLGRRTIHRFAQSLYKSLENSQVNLVKCKPAQIWMFLFGIIDAIYAIFDLINQKPASFLAGGCISATFIIASCLIDKHFKNFEQKSVPF